MKPITQALDILHADKKSYIGYLLWVTLCDAENIAAEIVHPKLRKDWTADASALDKGNVLMYVYTLWLCNYIWRC